MYMYIHLNVCKQMTDIKLLLLYSKQYVKPFNYVHRMIYVR